VQKITKLDLLIWLPRILFLVVAAIFLTKYFTYLNAVVPFPYDWEPTDGDHLNFAHRLAQGLPIYLPLKEGQVLSIYNPLYHAIVALLGGAQASLALARMISLFFWLLIPITIFFSFKKRWGFIYTAIASLVVLLPPEPSMLIDIVQLNPNSTMGFLFLATMLYANYCVEEKSASWYEWLLLGGISALCYLAKQQGLVALVITISFLFLQKIPKHKIMLTILGFSLIFLGSTVYLEYMNSGEYLRATLFDLHKIMITSSSLSKARLVEFLFKSNLFFIICVGYSFYASIKKDQPFSKLSIWQVSFVIHLPFLLAILGNGGGGPNYFLSMWISIVILCFEYLRVNQIKSTSKLTSQILLLGLLINSCIGIKTISKEIDAIPLPGQQVKKMMEGYYESVAEIVAVKKSPNILTHRNIGAFVAANIQISNEGCTMFSYAWHFPSIFNRESILSQIRQKKFDFISTGLQEYPDEVKLEIIKNYQPILTKEVNLYFGKIGTVILFAPKAD
jgi:hypothetical protein